MERQKHVNKSFVKQDFSGQVLYGYYNDCDFSNSDFRDSTIEIVAVDCKFDGSDFRKANIRRFYSPRSTFVGCKFEQPVTHGVYHKIKATFSVLHNHQIIAAIIRRWIYLNYPNDTLYRRRGLRYVKQMEDSLNLSWPELTRMFPDDLIEKGFRAFKDLPILYNKLLEHKPELEPEDLKNDRIEA